MLDSRPVISWINLAEGHHIEAARLKAVTPISFADRFALATAAARGLTLWTGDPEIPDVRDPRCVVADLRR